MGNGICCASGDDQANLAALRKGLDSSEAAFQVAAEPTVVQEPTLVVNKDEAAAAMAVDESSACEDDVTPPPAPPQVPAGTTLSSKDKTKREEGTEPEAAGPTPQAGQPQIVDVIVRKSGQQDKLGMDVKHMKGRLIVMQIFPGGAIDRANKECQAAGNECLEIGDTIIQVNDISDKDTTMVAECQRSDELRIKVMRQPS